MSKGKASQEQEAIQVEKCVCVNLATRGWELAIISLHRSDLAEVPALLGARLVSVKFLHNFFLLLQARPLMPGGFC